ncbi:g10301 [Coccomyxa elongata]
MASNLSEKSAADELAQTTWRDDAWLSFFPLNVFTALDYFALSPFYDRTCNNELAKSQGGDLKLATLPPGVEYEVQDAQEPHLFIIRKQHRSGPKTTAPLQYYYILDGNVYQAPSLHAALSSRISRCLHNVRTAFNLMQSDLDPLLKSAEAATAGARKAAPSKPVLGQQQRSSKEQERTVDKIIMNVLQKYPMHTADSVPGGNAPAESEVPFGGPGIASKAEEGAGSEQTQGAPLSR